MMNTESTRTANGYQGPSAPEARVSYEPTDESGEIGKALLVGVLGGVLSATGYLIYRRLPDEQKERLQRQVREAIQARIGELRRAFNL
jgi:hypothetical protein